MATGISTRGYGAGDADGLLAPPGVDGCMPRGELMPTSPGAGVAARARRSSGAVPARDPSALRCLQCQLLGRRRLSCARRDLCLEIPHLHPLGAILLVAWLATAAAFVVSLW